MSKYRVTNYRKKFLVETLVTVFTIPVWLPCNDKGAMTLRESSYALYDGFDQALSMAKQYEGNE